MVRSWSGLSGQKGVENAVAKKKKKKKRRHLDVVM